MNFKNTIFGRVCRFCANFFSMCEFFEYFWYCKTMSHKIKILKEKFDVIGGFYDKIQLLLFFCLLVILFLIRLFTMIYDFFSEYSRFLLVNNWFGLVFRDNLFWKILQILYKFIFLLFSFSKVYKIWKFEKQLKIFK